MKTISKFILLSLGLLMVPGLVQACSASNTARANQPVPAASASAASDFKVSSLAVNPPEANSGVKVLVTAQVTNTGSSSQTYTPKVRIDDVTGGALPSFQYLKDTVIAAGATERFSITLPPANPGSYRVTWGGLSREFKVTAANLDPAAGSAASGGKPAPDFTGVDVLTKRKVTLSSFKGSMVLLNFVNYGCDPSTNNVVSKQLLAIKELVKTRTDFTPVSVFCGCCPESVLKDFATQNGLQWPWILDTDYSIVNSYVDYLRQYGYPTLIFIDQAQNIQAVTGYTGPDDLSARLDRLSIQK